MYRDGLVGRIRFGWGAIPICWVVGARKGQKVPICWVVGARKGQKVGLLDDF